MRAVAHSASISPHLLWQEWAAKLEATHVGQLADDDTASAAAKTKKRVGKKVGASRRRKPVKKKSMASEEESDDEETENAKPNSAAGQKVATKAAPARRSRSRRKA